jgi:N-acetyl-gamma-glutamyl-phosphate reductase
VSTKPLIFVDGEEGTTGLQIFDRLARRPDLEVLKIDPDRRKDPEARRALLNEADVAFLCLPDAAARESVALVANSRTRLIDTSTAHRTSVDWAYGIPELDVAARGAIRETPRLSVPGCHATGFVMNVYPLVKEGIIPADSLLTCHSISGYSGGGKKLIAQYEAPDADRQKLSSPRMYALSLKHKHLPEMRVRGGLEHAPVFSPIVGDFYQGMVVSVPLFPSLLHKKVTAADVREILAGYYAAERFVKVMPYEAEPLLDGGFLDAQACNGTNNVDLFVFGGDDRILLAARLDNLGKGSSGAAVQCMNIVLGQDEGLGLAS